MRSKGIANYLLVGSYTMLSWQLIKEVLIAVYKHHNIKAHICLASYSYVVDKIYPQMVQGVRDSPIMLKNSPIMQAW